MVLSLEINGYGPFAGLGVFVQLWFDHFQGWTAAFWFFEAETCVNHIGLDHIM